MSKKNLLKKISLSIASLALVCPLALGGLSNSNVANARRRPRTHRVYRHHRRIRRARGKRATHKRRHARRTKRNRRTRRHRFTRKNRRRHTVRHTAHRARRHHARHHNYYYDNYANDITPTENTNPVPVYHPRNTLAQWYKANGSKLYINENGAGTDFNDGWGDGIVSNPGINTDGFDDSQYKHGWIDGASLQLNNDSSSFDGSDDSAINALNSEPTSYYAHTIRVWNSGYHYARNHSLLDDYGEPIYYQGNYHWSDM